VTADLDTLLIGLYVLACRVLPEHRGGPGRKPQITDAELVCLAVAQILLDCPSERRFLRFAMVRLSHLFPYLPKQPGYNKRLRRLTPQIVRVLNAIAFSSPSWCDNIRLLDSTPVPCGQSKETVKRSDFAGHATYGYCASHSRYFWGFRLYLLCASDGMPIAFELAPANAPERDVAAEMLAHVQLDAYTVIADKGFAGEDFETLMTELGAIFLRPDRKTSPAGSAASEACANGSNRSSTPSRANSRSNATAPTPWPASSPASPNACSRSPPACGTTKTSATRAAISPPTTTEPHTEMESVI